MKAQNLLYTLHDEVNKNNARIEESIKQNNLQAKNANADSLSQKTSLTKSHMIIFFFFTEIPMALDSHANKIDESRTKYQ